MSLADRYFKEQVDIISQTGFNDKDYLVRPHWEDGTPAHTIKTFCDVRRYDLEKEFPILTIRNAPFKTSVKEVLWMFQKKSNNVNDLDCKIWDAWADENGSIGKTYGYVVGETYDYPEGNMDQIDYVIYQLKNNPMQRRIIMQLWKPEYQKGCGLPPCLCSYYFDVSNDRLNCMVVMRSGDVLAAAGAGEADTIEAALLVHMLAQCCGYQVGELVMVVNNLHIYDRHLEMCKTICKNTEYDAPKLWINPEITDFYQFTTDDFKLTDYQYTKLGRRIPVAI